MIAATAMPRFYQANDREVMRRKTQMGVWCVAPHTLTEFGGEGSNPYSQNQNLLSCQLDDLRATEKILAGGLPGAAFSFVVPAPIASLTLWDR
jgi:hypothetical protein